MKASPMHAALSTLPSPALSSDGVESYRLACGGVSTRVDIRDDSDLITCKRCRRALADALPVISPYNNVVTELRDKASIALIEADPDVAHAREYLLDKIGRVRRLLESAMQDLDREVAGIRMTTIESYGALDRAMTVARIPGYIASNLDVQSLARYGANLDAELRRAARGELGDRGRWAAEAARKEA